MNTIQASFILSIPLLLIACGSEPETETTTDTTKTEIPVVNPDEQLLNSDSLTEANLIAFPKHWVQIDMETGEKIYYNYCGMGHPHWKLNAVDSSWQIETFYGQDAELWDVMSMTANIQTAENQILQEGIFVVTKNTYPDDEIYEVSYFWNQTAGFCTFGDFFDKSKRFADFAEFDSFIVKDEKCPE